MKISVGCDHAGFEYKRLASKYLLEKGYDIVDEGSFSNESCHYPEYALKVAERVAAHKADYGIIFCSSGQGVCIAANKVKGIRCGIGYNDQVTTTLRSHNNGNIIAFGATYTSIEEVYKRIDIFLNTEFLGGRHQIRVEMISDFENK